MNTQPVHIASQEVVNRRAVTDSPPVVAALILLFAMCVSLIFAVSVIPRPGQPWSPFTVANIHDATAAAKPLPIDTVGWPPAREYLELYLLGRREYEVAFAPPGRPITHSARVNLYGWPMGCLIEVDRWGPDGDPERHTSPPSRTPLNVRWIGLFVDTLTFAAPIGLVFLTPLLLRKLVRAWRRRRGLCPVCCYPVGASSVCTECGSPVRNKLGLQGSGA
ncbi:MAG: hypothetical protein GC200_06375 [Tepidisphaera sp.]|nr:hypothetical protein [Tepidisphaera sp.]